MPKHDTIYSIHLVKPTNKKLSMHDPSYEQAGIPFTQNCGSVSSLVGTCI